MRSEIYFKNIDEIGDLYLDYVFLEYEYEPIYFTCVDDFENIYLCLCSEIRGKQRWVISKSNRAILRKLIDQQLDMAEAMCLFGYVVIVDRDIHGNEQSFPIDSETIDELDLPKRGTMLRCDRESALDYVMGKDANVSFREQRIVLEVEYSKDISIKLRHTGNYKNQALKRMKAYVEYIQQAAYSLESEVMPVKNRVNQLPIYRTKTAGKDDCKTELDKNYLFAA